MCWSSHRAIRDSWVVERRPRADVRASDADRQATIDQLSRHTGDGRLTLEDFEARVDEAVSITVASAAAPPPLISAGSRTRSVGVPVLESTAIASAPRWRPT